MRSWRNFPMTKKDTNRWSDCIHEAGHYVAFKLASLNLPEVHEVWVGGDRGVHPHVLLEKLDRLQRDRLIKDRESALGLAVAFLAGPAASMKILGRSYDDFEPSETSDQMKAVRFLDDHVWTTDADLEAQLSGSAVDPLITEAALRTRVFVDEHRDLIEAVANRLYYRGSLDSIELLKARRDDATFLLIDLIETMRRSSHRPRSRAASSPKWLRYSLHGAF